MKKFNQITEFGLFEELLPTTANNNDINNQADNLDESISIEFEFNNNINTNANNNNSNKHMNNAVTTQKIENCFQLIKNELFNKNEFI